MADQVPDAAAPRRARTDLTSSLVRVAFVTEESIYGIILVSGMIVVTGTHGATSWFVFWTVLFTVVVFWAAHVYAGTVARHAFDDEHMMGIREAFGASLRHSLGLLASSFIPLLILLLGATQAINDTTAIWVALWAGVVVLAVLGWVAFSRRGASWPIRVAGSLGTAAFGIAMILAKAFIH